MDRRTIIATAGAITLTVLAGSTAIAANVGILGNSSKAPVGQLSPVVNLETTSTAKTAKQARSLATTTSTLPPEVETIYVDQYVPGTAGSDPVEVPPVAPAAPSDPSESDDGTTPTATSYDDQSEVDDDSSDDGSDDQEDEGGHEEYSGAEDDD